MKNRPKQNLDTARQLEWVHKGKNNFYRVTAMLNDGTPEQVTATIQIRGVSKGGSLSSELGAHAIRMLNLMVIDQCEKEQSNEAPKG